MQNGATRGNLQSMRGFPDGMKAVADAVHA